MNATGSFTLDRPQVESLLQVIGLGVQLWDRAGRLVYANPTTALQFGIEPGVGQDFAGLVARCRDLQGGDPVARVLGGWPGEEEMLIEVVPAPGVHVRWLKLHAYAVPAGAEAAVLTTSGDVTSIREETLGMQRQASYDLLTGLPNRLLLADRFRVALARARRSGELLAVGMLDLDGFKPVNDTLGHEAGDEVLQEVARRIAEELRADDTAARIGGDEFALLIGGLRGADELEALLQRLLLAVAAPIRVAGASARVTASIGLSLFPGDLDSAETLLKHADQAMYRAKEAGRNRYCFHDPAITLQVAARHGLLNKIEDGLSRGEFELHYQPKVDCVEGRVVGLEALIRWRHPVLGLRSPGEFLPLIEQDDLGIRLGDWVAAAALRQMREWRDAGIAQRVAINVSARQFLHADFGAAVLALQREHAPELLRLLDIEIVEAAAMDNVRQASALVRACRDAGIGVALDDFGHGHTSLMHLKRLGVDALKIDQPFVRDMLHDAGDRSIVRGVIALAGAFQAQVIAEGVESIGQLLALLEMGCSVMQGDLIAPALPAEAVPGWLDDFRADPRWREPRRPERGAADLKLEPTE